MKFSENRPLAWAVLFVCVLVSIVLFGGLGLREDRQSVEEVFYTGADDAYFSLNGYIDRRAAAAQKLAAMGFALLGDSDAGTLSLSTAVAAVQAADTPDEKLLANAEMGRCADGLYARISASEAGERDQKDARMRLPVNSRSMEDPCSIQQFSSSMESTVSTSRSYSSQASKIASLYAPKS